MENALFKNLDWVLIGQDFILISQLVVFWAYRQADPQAKESDADPQSDVDSQNETPGEAARKFSNTQTD